MKKLIQTWFLFEDETTWGEMLQVAALSAVAFIIFWATLYLIFLLWG